MANKKAAEVINTLPFDMVFATNVKVDTEHRVLYDTSTGIAIGFITPHFDIIEITVKPPEWADIELRRVDPDLMDYFNLKYVSVSNHNLYYAVSNGYVKIGKMSGYRADLVLPRILVACEATETDDSYQD